MSVQLRGKKYHYRFRLKEHRFSGVCENCTTEKDALKFEEQVYAEKLKEYEAAGRFFWKKHMCFHRRNRQSGCRQNISSGRNSASGMIFWHL